MNRFGIMILVVAGVGSGLGGCSTAMDYTSSISDREAFAIGSTITPKNERNHLIEMLNRVKLTHHSKALDEIEAR